MCATNGNICGGPCLRNSLCGPDMQWPAKVETTSPCKATEYSPELNLKAEAKSLTLPLPSNLVLGVGWKDFMGLSMNCHSQWQFIESPIKSFSMHVSECFITAQHKMTNSTYSKHLLVI